MKLESTT